MAFGFQPRVHGSLVPPRGPLTMHYLAFLAVALPFASATLLNARTMVLHERREAVPSGFVKVGAAPKQETLTLRLGLVQGDMSALEERLYAVSTPSSSEYGKFLSKEEVMITLRMLLSTSLIIFYRLNRLWHLSKRRSTP